MGRRGQAVLRPVPDECVRTHARLVSHTRKTLNHDSENWLKYIELIENPAKSSPFSMP